MGQDLQGIHYPTVLKKESTNSDLQLHKRLNECLCFGETTYTVLSHMEVGFYHLPFKNSLKNQVLVQPVLLFEQNIYQVMINLYLYKLR